MTSANDDGSAQIESRLRDLEKKVDELKPKKKDRWDKAQIVGFILSPFLTCALSFVLINRVNLGLERQHSKGSLGTRRNRMKFLRLWARHIHTQALHDPEQVCG